MSVTRQCRVECVVEQKYDRRRAVRRQVSRVTSNAHGCRNCRSSMRRAVHASLSSTVRVSSRDSSNCETRRTRPRLTSGQRTPHRSIILGRVSGGPVYGAGELTGTGINLSMRLGPLISSGRRGRRYHSRPTSVWVPFFLRLLFLSDLLKDCARYNVECYARALLEGRLAHLTISTVNLILGTSRHDLRPLSRLLLTLDRLSSFLLTLYLTTLLGDLMN